MKNAILIGLSLATLAVVPAAFAQSHAQSRVNATNEPYCLKDHSDAATECTYRTFNQCLQDRAGQNGECIVNPNF